MSGLSKISPIRSKLKVPIFSKNSRPDTKSFAPGKSLASHQSSSRLHQQKSELTPIPSRTAITPQFLRSNSNRDSTLLLSTLKAYLLQPVKEIKQIIKEIQKFTAKRTQELKKNYKSSENLDSLAACLLSVYSTFDEVLKIELTSLRTQPGEAFTNYLSNAGRFINVTRGLPQVLKKIEIDSKTLNDLVRLFSNVKETKLSSIYRDLYEFLKLILDYFKKYKNLPTKGLNKSFSCESKAENPNKSTFTHTCNLKVLETPEKSSEFSLLDISNQPKSTRNVNENSARTPKSNLYNLNAIRAAGSNSTTSLYQKGKYDAKSTERIMFREKLAQTKKQAWEDLRERKKKLKEEKQNELVMRIHFQQIENERTKELEREKLKKEKEEIRRYKDEEFKEKKRLKEAEHIRAQAEKSDELRRNIEKSKIWNN